MPYVRTVSFHEAKGDLKTIYNQMLEAGGKIYNVDAVNSIRPHIMKTLWVHYSSVMGSDSGLSLAERQMIATVVSALNKCQY